MIRDNKQTLEYYDLAFNYKENKLNEFLESVHDKEHDNTPGLWTFIQSIYFELADIMYSRGDDLKDIKAMIEKGLEVQAVKMQHYRKRRISLQDVMKEETTDNYPEFKKVYSNSASFQYYYSILQILSRAIIFDVNKELFQKYIEDVTMPGVDFIFDWLIHSQNNNWPIRGKLNYPKKIEELYNAANATNLAETEINLKKYVASRLTKLRGHPLFGPHMMKGYNYTGYWCFEVSAIAKLKGITGFGLLEIKK